MHVPVMLGEVIAALDVRPGRTYVDATVGQGGHASAILTASAPDGRLLGLDRDAKAIEAAKVALAQFGDRVLLVTTSYTSIATIAQSHGLIPVDGVLFDLGYSSAQLDMSGRGFSFQRDEPLDMRFGEGDATASDLVNGMPERELADLLYQYGEERDSRVIAHAIVANRPIETSSRLATVIQAVAPRHEKIHPATRTFQALRIAVNDELGSLETALPQTVSMLKPGGRLVVISFHSLEDRIVKQFMRRESADCVCPPRMPRCVCGHSASLRVVADKVAFATKSEVQANPRARSARLRVAERLPATSNHASAGG